MTSRVSSSRADAYVVAIKFPSDLWSRSLKNPMLWPQEIFHLPRRAPCSSIAREGELSTPEVPSSIQILEVLIFEIIAKLEEIRRISIFQTLKEPSHQDRWRSVSSVPEFNGVCRSNDPGRRAREKRGTVAKGRVSCSRVRRAGRKGLQPSENISGDPLARTEHLLVLDSSIRGRLPSF